MNVDLDINAGVGGISSLSVLAAFMFSLENGRLWSKLLWRQCC
ncbi:hypothetical protein [Bradyrhizobium barranii]|nr:hypothetical protein [Bradyrhizobium japonicum]